MTTSSLSVRLAGWLAAACLALAVVLPAQAADAGSPAGQQAARQLTQPGNNAPVWREVRQDQETTCGDPVNHPLVGRKALDQLAGQRIVVGQRPLDLVEKQDRQGNDDDQGAAI